MWSWYGASISWIIGLDIAVNWLIKPSIVNDDPYRPSTIDLQIYKQGYLRGSQSIAKLVYKWLISMVYGRYIRLVNGNCITMVYKPTMVHIFPLKMMIFHINHHFPMVFPWFFSTNVHITEGAHPVRIARNLHLRNFWEHPRSPKDAPTPHSSREPRCPVPAPLGSGWSQAFFLRGKTPSRR